MFRDVSCEPLHLRATALNFSLKPGSSRHCFDDGDDDDDDDDEGMHIVPPSGPSSLLPRFIALNWWRETEQATTEDFILEKSPSMALSESHKVVPVLNIVCTMFFSVVEVTIQ